MPEPLLVDISPWSRTKPSQWRDLAAAGPPWTGGIVKASEGAVDYARWRGAPWLGPHWSALGDAGGDLGRPWLRGAYHFLIADGCGAPQADAFLDALERAGGWRPGDLWPIVDVEEGSGNGARAARLGCSVVEDTCAAFAARVRERLGAPTILYAGWWLRSIGIRSRMGCEWLWYASYTPKLSTSTYGAIGWSADRLILWQYDGSGDSNGHLHGYPTRAPIDHGEDVDISALTIPGGLARLTGMLAAPTCGGG